MNTRKETITEDDNVHADATAGNNAYEAEQINDDEDAQ